VGTLILDASVLIGLLDTADAHHSRAVDDVEAADLASERLLAPASAYSEALVSFARARRTDEARDAITAMGISVTPMTGPVAESAAELSAAHDRLRLPDAIVLATARELHARLLTYDDDLAKIAPRGITADEIAHRDGCSR
jgi:predicted nucleic acid-binding protein